MNNVSREPARRQAQEAGTLLYMDIWGPYSIEGYDGSKYVLMITDDATRFTWAETLSTRGNLLKPFWRMHKAISRTPGVTVRGYRCDNEFS